ncbi:hypothetical protein OA79_07790 [Marinomonas sp. TW1]|nr:hypothetical protein OA79_07790 [Marinomonas sp. TW1]
MEANEDIAISGMRKKFVVCMVSPRVSVITRLKGSDWLLTSSLPKRQSQQEDDDRLKGQFHYDVAKREEVTSPMLETMKVFCT